MVLQRKGAARIGGWIRDLWIALGITLFAFGMVELAYIGQRAARSAWFGSDAEREAQEVGHPFAGQDWYLDFLRARDGTREKYDPWRGYWAYPTTSPHLNVDSAGYRVTLQPTASGQGRRTVFLLGGSAMWGYTARDSMTIASLVAAGLHAVGISDVEVINLAQPGYTVAHEVATLMHELQRGRSPAVAVFFTGINDIRTTQHTQEPGHVFFEGRFTHLFEVESQRGFFASLVTPGERSRVIQRLLLALGAPNEWAVPPQKPGTCDKLGRYFRNVHDDAVAIGGARGFDVLFVQQPIHATTHKTPTPFESTFMGPPAMLTYTRDCASAIDAAMSTAVGSTYLSYASLFDDETQTVFLDRYAHVTEVANRRIAAELVKEISARLAN